MCVRNGNTKVAPLLLDVYNVNYTGDAFGTHNFGKYKHVLTQAIKTRQTVIANDILNFIKENDLNTIKQQQV